MNPTKIDQNCPSLAELQAFHQGALPAAQADMVAIHLEGCANCEAVLDGLDAQEGTIVSSLRRSAAVGEAAGDLLGDRYRLVELLGEGGMGAVWRAEQLEPVRREVAVKLVKAGMDSRAVLRRFAAERQALALMDHPNIARVFDAGTTSQGRPYFVMELVPGVPITRYCDSRQMPLGQRLELFVLVCRAVQHAHQKGVIHRDLKPGNVLVIEVDGRPVPKVIDFGVAKAAGVSLLDDSQANSIGTLLGTVVGTPEYMAPEQAGGNTADVDTRADVYALGVLLYELLTGTTPLTRIRLRQAGILEILRLVREEEPPAPSSRLSTAEALPSIAAERGTEPARLNRQIRGDLDWVVLKALEKDRSRRYESAGGFARDIERYLADEPVEAGRPGTAYRLRKFIRRNRRQVVVVISLGLLLAAGLAFVWNLDRQSTIERERLKRNQLAINGLLDQAGIALNAGDAAKTAILLETASRQFHEGGTEQAQERLKALQVDLELLQRLDLVDRFAWTLDEQKLPADHQVVKRYQQVLTQFGINPDSNDPVQVATQLATSTVRERLLRALDYVLRQNGSLATREVLRLADPDPYRDAVRDSWVLRTFWSALAGFPTAMAMSAKVADKPAAADQPAGFLAILGYDPVLPESTRRELLETAIGRHPNDLTLLLTMAAVYRPAREKNAGELLRWYQAAAAAAPDNPTPFLNLGATLSDRGELSGAQRAYREALRRDPNDALAHNNLGLILAKEGKMDAAEQSFREAILLNPRNDRFHNNLGAAYQMKGNFAAAELEIREAIRIDPTNPKAHFNLGALQQQQGDLAGAERSYREAIRLNSQLAPAHDNLGMLLGQRGDFEGASRSFQEAVRLEPNDVRAQYNLGVALDRKGDWDGAERAYREVIRLAPSNARAQSNLGAILGAKGDYAGAEKSYREAVRLKPDYAVAHYNLGLALEQNGDFQAAARSYAEVVRLNPKLPNAEQNRLRAERRQELLLRLAQVIAGKDKPANASEALAFAEMCQLDFQKQFAVAVQLYDKAFADMPELIPGYQYEAALAAIRAGWGEGVNAPAVANDRARLRAKALNWLRSALAQYQKLATSADAAQREQAAQVLNRWFRDQTLSKSRASADWDKLPAKEQSEWKALWDQVRATQVEALKKSSPQQK